MDTENWVPIWRGLAVTLLREGYCSMKAAPGLLHVVLSYSIVPKFNLLLPFFGTE